MKFLLLVLASITFTSAYSAPKLDRSFGEWGSGGGNAVVCFFDTPETPNILKSIRENDNLIPSEHLGYIKSIEMYDLYEAKKRRGLSARKPEIITINENEEVYDYLDRLALRYKQRVPVMSGIISYAKDLIPDSQFVFHDFAVEYQNDLGNVTLPSNNCVISTMAAQVNENDYFMVHIDERLYNHHHHSYQSKATLILHELIYGLFRREFDHKTSGATRNIVKYFLSYHDSITEGRVARSLSEMDLFFFEDPFGRINNEFTLSNISTEIFSSSQLIQRTFEAHYETNERAFFSSSLYRNIQDAAEGSGVDLSSVETSLYGIYNLLEKMRDINSDVVWWNLYNDFNNYLIKKVSMSEVRYNYFLNQAKSSLRDLTNITDSELKIFEERYNSLFSDFKNVSFSFQYFVEEVLNKRKSDSNLQKAVEDDFFRLTVCEDDRTVPPTDIKNNFCTGPIKISNIIPR